MPSLATLKKYGLELSEWQSMYDSQGGLCPICLRPMKKANVDHFHRIGWKKLEPQERKLYVRQLVCFQCNFKLLWRGVTADRLRRAADYLDKWNATIGLDDNK